MATLPESQDNAAMSYDANYGLVASGSQNYVSIVDPRDSANLVAAIKPLFHAEFGTD